jgi:hypothetical protein
VTHYGRHHLGRPGGKLNRCQGCGVRLTIGDPRPLNGWPERLVLDDFTVNVLLTAAADYRELCIEADEPERAIDFVDWVAGVLRQSGIRFEADGAPPRNESGTAADVRQMRHRHPDPIPYAELPRTWR